MCSKEERRYKVKIGKKYYGRETIFLSKNKFKKKGTMKNEITTVNSIKEKRQRQIILFIGF